MSSSLVLLPLIRSKVRFFAIRSCMSALTLFTSHGIWIVVIVCVTLAAPEVSWKTALTTVSPPRVSVAGSL